jgi:hypothetical protein
VEEPMLADPLTFIWLFNTCAGLQTLDKGIFMHISFKETAKSCVIARNCLTNMYTKWGSIEYT